MSECLCACVCMDSEVRLIHALLMCKGVGLTPQPYSLCVSFPSPPTYHLNAEGSKWETGLTQISIQLYRSIQLSQVLVCRQCKVDHLNSQLNECLQNIWYRNSSPKNQTRVMDYLYITIMFLSAVWTLILMAPIHYALINKWYNGTFL